MRITILLAAALLAATGGCKNKTQADAEKKAADISNTVQQASSPGNTDPNGLYMKAAINGKEWVASNMLEGGTVSDYKHVQGDTPDYSIEFSLFKPVSGQVIELSEDKAINFTAPEGIYGGRKGSITVSKADGQWIEGRFHFTATSSSSPGTFEVTDGFFRIPATPAK